jgi:leucyl aminopeptidase
VLRTTTLRVARTLTRRRVVCSLAELPLASGDAGAIVAESLLLGTYAYTPYRTDTRTPPVSEIALTGVSQAALAEGRALGAAASYARDLVNAPASELTPLALAECCVEQARSHGLECTLLEANELRSGGFGGMLAVGTGSVHPPVLAVLELRRGDGPVTALVGKGITFDSGGLQAKGAAAMRAMKCDMAGAASILAAIGALGELDVDVNVRAYLACAENAMSGAAYRPGDIVRHRSGRTTEVVSTDAEGRLVLADAIAYAAEGEPDAIVSVSTLTGGTGLGRDLWGVLGADSELVSALLDAGRKAGEPGWALPLWEPYRAELRSSVADAVNYDFGWRESMVAGGPPAMFGALFLSPFFGERPWAQLDIAATSWRVNGDDDWAPGATGSPTRALVAFLRDRSQRS